MSYVRHAAVAGMFYPSNARDLSGVVQRLLIEAGARVESGPVPKAIIAPHAGFAYSGPIAASAYARLKPAFDRIKRVVMIGPSHRVLLPGLGVSTAKAFETPLGMVPLDTEMIGHLLRLPGVIVSEEAHAEEHSLEVQLPFLQCVIDDFSIVPLVCNRASATTIANVLEAVWGSDETIIIVSSDLSHYLDYASARRSDGNTCRAIEALDGESIDSDQACGRGAVCGLLKLAKRLNMRVRTLDLRNSGDTTGDKRRVVGYGAWMFTERRAGVQPMREVSVLHADATARIQSIVDDHGFNLLRLAASSILNGADCGVPLTVDADAYPMAIRDHVASFVTLHHDEALRGCIGTSIAHRPLVTDVAANAYAAAFSDHRFSPPQRDSLMSLTISVSLLTEPWKMVFEDEADLGRQLRPGVDGVILEHDGKRALFLPQVWEPLGDPASFLRQLKKKAGMDVDFWSSTLCAWRFETRSISTRSLADTHSVWTSIH